MGESIILRTEELAIGSKFVMDNDELLPGFESVPGANPRAISFCLL